MGLLGPGAGHRTLRWAVVVYSVEGLGGDTGYNWCVTQRNRLSAGMRERRAQLIASESAAVRKRYALGLLGAGLAGTLAVVAWPSGEPDIGDETASPPAKAQVSAADTGAVRYVVPQRYG